MFIFLFIDFSVEPFLDVDYEYRIQKIGQRYSCFRRAAEGSWKANMGTESHDLEFEDYPFDEKHRLWIDECAKVLLFFFLIIITIFSRLISLDVWWSRYLWPRRCQTQRWLRGYLGN